MNRSRRDRDRRRNAGRPARELTAQTDECLVERVLRGDDRAFEVLFDRHVADALWFAREALGSWGEAEEAVRHSFAAAHAYLATRDRGVEFAPWLHTILGNHCLSMLHAREPQPGEEESKPLAPVVDLDEWRRRRGGLGAVALPAALSAGLRDSVLAACGIGAGGAAGGAAMVGGGSLLGGALAKVAVVALLAGSVGAAGKAVSERDPSTRQAVVATADTELKSPGRRGTPRLASAVPRVALERIARELRRAGARARAPAAPLRGGEPLPAVAPEAPVASAPVAPAVAHAPPVVGPAPHAPPAGAGGGTGQVLVKEVERALAEVLPPAGSEPAPSPELDPLPPPVADVVEGLPAIGDDLPVNPDALNEDLGGLLPPELQPPNLPPRAP